MWRSRGVRGNVGAGGQGIKQEEAKKESRRKTVPEGTIRTSGQKDTRVSCKVDL